MQSKSTLYELLGVSPLASAADVQAAYRRELDALEAQRGEMTPQAIVERAQVLRVAFSTLGNAALRAAYDAELQSAERAARAAAGMMPSMVSREQVRAEALGLRADALSLRADAMLARAELEGTTSRRAAGLLAGASTVLRALGLLVVIGIAAFGFTRCTVAGSAQQRAVAEVRAAEQVALQDYYQTYGVRPANMAELELMEAERRRRENDARQAEQERRQQTEQQRRWEEESRRIGERVSQDLQRADEEARRLAARVRMLKEEEEQLKLELQLARDEAERRRLELRIKQLRQRIDEP